jgi:hypothetical protein
MSWVEAMKIAVGVGDYIKFNVSKQEQYGLILAGGDDTQVQVLLLSRVTTEMFERYSMHPISAAAYPMTYSSQIPELIGLGECMCLSQHCITDIIFVFPLQEVESGFISIAGANPTYFQWFAIHNNSLIPCPATVYFARYLVEPLSVRLF